MSSNDYGSIDVHNGPRRHGKPGVNRQGRAGLLSSSCLRNDSRATGTASSLDTVTSSTPVSLRASTTPSRSSNAGPTAIVTKNTSSSRSRPPSPENYDEPKKCPRSTGAEDGCISARSAGNARPAVTGASRSRIPPGRSRHAESE